MASSSPGKGDMMKQAQHIWSMLDELAESDPDAYKKFIEKNAQESKEVMTPAKPYMCLQTKILRPESCELIINICSWTRIPKPKTDEEPIAVTGGPLELEDCVQGQDTYKIVRLAVNPYVLDECCKHREDKAMLIQLGLQYLEQHHKIGISRHYTMLDIQYKGDPSILLKNFFLKKDGSGRNDAEDFLNDINTMSPSSLLSQLGKMSTDETEKGDINSNGNTPIISLSGSADSGKPAKSQLIEEIASEDVKFEIPRHEVCVKDADDRRTRKLVVKVLLPGITSVKGCELDITEDEILLTAAGLYELKLALPESIKESKASAKFSSKTSSLIITLPTINQS